MRGMEELRVDEAPRWRSMLAGLFDAGLVAGVLWLARDRRTPRALRVAASALAPTGELVREQLGSPGQRLLGLRTIDRRTGMRVALWRTLVVAGAAAAAPLLTRRLMPREDPEGDRRREQMGRRLGEIHRLYPMDSDVRQDALRRAYEEIDPPPIRVDLVRMVPATIGVGILSRRLRRRLAPTVEVLARPRADHSP